MGSSLYHVGFFVVALRLSCPVACGISVLGTWDWTSVLCIWRWILNHWTTSEVPEVFILRPIKLNLQHSPCAFFKIDNLNLLLPLQPDTNILPPQASTDLPFFLRVKKGAPPKVKTLSLNPWNTSLSTFFQTWWFSDFATSNFPHVFSGPLLHRVGDGKS